MNKFTLLILLGFSLMSCSQKVYFFDAVKLESTEKNDIDFDVNAYFAGDALDYVVFELDIKNYTSDSLFINYRDIYLEVLERDSRQNFILDALDKNDVVFELEQTRRQMDREKKGRDIGNAISLGLNLVLAGTGNLNSVDAFIYSADTASYMLEDSRSHNLIKGSLEEQITYLDDWVIYKEMVGPKSEGTWDVLFNRQLFDAKANFVVEINNEKYIIPFKLETIEERVR